MKKNYRKCLKMKQFSFHNAVMLPKGTDQIANIVDPDQTAFKERSDLDLQSSLIPICPNA